MRHFDQKTIPKGGHAEKVAFVVCCVCHAEETMGSTKSRILPPDVLATKFRQKGWQIGHNSSKDKCPDCIAKERGLSKPTPINQPSRELDFNSQIRTAAAVSAIETPPRVPSREDNQLIFTAVQEAYSNKSMSYQPGVTDGSIARDLNYPRPWVSAIREQFFGPVTDPRLAVLEDRYAALEDRARKIVTDTATFMSDLQGFRMDLNTLKGD